MYLQMMMLKLNKKFKENAKILSWCIWESNFTFLIPVLESQENFSPVYYELKRN